MSAAPIRRTNSIAGFTLIEVLIALLILAVGLLGVAALQFKGMRYSNDAFMRSQIAVLAHDLIGSMHSDRRNAASYLNQRYEVPLDTGANTCDQTASTGGIGCWHNAVDNALPPGSTANVSCANNLFTVTLAWTDREGQTHAVPYAFSLFKVLTCPSGSGGVDGAAGLDAVGDAGDTDDADDTDLDDAGATDDLGDAEPGGVIGVTGGGP